MVIGMGPCLRAVIYRPGNPHATIPPMNKVAEDLWLAGVDGLPMAI
jgi:hypothetical protein